MTRNNGNPSTPMQAYPGGILGLIPARGASTGITKKNLALLAGKPLIQYTFESALESRELDSVVLSTDDPEIADLGHNAGVKVPFMRPPWLSTDEAPTAPVVEHAVTWLWDNWEYRFDAVLVLQPTSPLRQSWNIDEAVKMFRDKNPDGVVSVSEVTEHAYDQVSFAGGEMRPAIERSTDLSRRQDFPALYFINGAIYLVATSVLMRDHTILPKRSIPYVMDRLSSLDVDSTLDLRIAECFLDLSRQ